MDPDLFYLLFLCLKSSHNEDLGSNRRPWGYESRPAYPTHLTLRKNRTNKPGRGRKEALMRYMKNQKQYETRQNLDKIVLTTRMRIKASGFVEQ